MAYVAPSRPISEIITDGRTNIASERLQINVKVLIVFNNRMQIL